MFANNFVNKAGMESFFTAECKKDRMWIRPVGGVYVQAMDYFPRTNANSVVVGERVTGSENSAYYEDLVIPGDFHGEIVFELLGGNTSEKNAYFIDVASLRREKTIPSHTPFSITGFENGDVQTRIRG